MHSPLVIMQCSNAMCGHVRDREGPLAFWLQAVDSGAWDKPVTDLPDANTWPTWGALRERVLTACREVSCRHDL